MVKNYFSLAVILFCCLFLANSAKAQVTTGASGTYGLRLINPSYAGKAINVRRGCDNKTLDIGFSCGALNTTQLTNFAIIANPLTAVSTTSSMAYSLRKMNCAYAGNAINVRRSCDNATQDIGFTATGDFDTTGLQQFVFKASPLTAISAAAGAAYSLRKLYCAYAGSAILVRRSSDNTTLAIGFTANGDLDTASMKTFVGANNGFIATWYDQSGNGNTATAPANGNQPQIIAAGVVKRQNSLPTAVFDGASSYLTILYAAGSMNLATASTCNAVLARTAAAGGTCDAVFCQQYTGGNISAALSWNSLPAPGTTLAYGYYPPGWQNAELPVDVTVNTDNIITGTILSGAVNTTAINLYQNGTLETAMTNQTTVGANSGLAFNIGKRWDLANYAPINLQELIVFTSVLSTTDRQYLEFSQSAYYGISGPPSLSTVPVAAPSAYIAKWYDQSGNGRDASQATAANQPRIMNAGIIDRQNGLPAVFFNNTGASGYTIGLQTANLNIFASAACFLGVASVKTNLTYNSMIAKTGSNGPPPAADNYPCPFDFYYNNGTSTTQMLVGNGNTTSFNSFTASQNFNAGSGLSIWTYQANGTNANGVNAYYNGATQIITNQTATVFGDQNTPLTIGARFDGVTGLNGWISEVFIFNAIPVAADIDYLEYTQGQYYGIAGPTYVAPSSSANLSAYITTWYDQSGHANNAVQATTANQPLIIKNGSINLQGTLPSINFNGTSQDLTASAFTTAFNNTAGGGGTLNMMAVNNGAASWQGMAQQGRTPGTWWGIWGSNTGKWTGGFSGGPGNMVSAVNSSVFEPITVIQLPTVSTTLFGNGTQLLTNATMANLSNANSFYIGLGAAGEYWNGNSSEINIFSTGLGTTQRTLLETNQGAYYSFTPTNSQFTPANGYNLLVNGIGETSAADKVSSTTQSAGMGFIDVTFLGVGNYMTSGMTCPTATVSFANLPAGATAGYERWANDWLINIANPAATAGNIQIYFDFIDYGVSANGLPAVASNYQLWGRSNPANTFTVVPTTAVAIGGASNQRVIFTLPVANLANGGYYTIGTIDYQNSPLPIELLYFAALPVNNTVDLNWATSTEINNNFFTIEKSKDGVNFDYLKQIPTEALNGNSNITLNYKTYDVSPYEGINYYRLTQTDRNGNNHYANITQVNFSNKSFVSVFPNPASNTIFVNVSPDYDNANLKLIDALGREVLSQSINSTNVNSINTSALTSGMYIMIIDNGNGISKTKVTIQK
jgi:hypothetical protein